MTSEAPRTVEVNGHTYTRIDLLDHVIVNGQFYVKPHFPGDNGNITCIIDKGGGRWCPSDRVPGQFALARGSSIPRTYAWIDSNYGIKEIERNG